MTTLPTEVTRWLADIEHRGLAINTHRAYASDRRFFQAWHRARFGTEARLPIAETVLVTFVADCLATLPVALSATLQAEGHKASAGPHTLSTVQRRLVSLHTWHIEAGVPSACRHDTVRQVLRRARRAAHPASPARSLPITLAVLQPLLGTCDATLRGQRDRALLLIGWCCGGRRRSELAALNIDDVDHRGLTIKTSKTDQCGEGLWVPIAAPAKRALQIWRANLGDSGALFRRIRRGGVIGERLDGGGINRIIKRHVQEAGLNPVQYSAHGLRSGFLTECERQGIPLPAAMALSGHRSPDVAVGYLAATGHHPVIALLDRLL